MSEFATGRTLISTAWELVEYYLSPIKEFLGEPDITEICVNDYKTIFIERKGQFIQIPGGWKDQVTLETCIEQIANALGQEVHRDIRPILDARLPDGSRVNAVLAPVAHSGTCMTVRLFPKVTFSGQDLLERGVYTPEIYEYLMLTVACRFNTLMSGSTGSGKTTLMNVLAAGIPEEDRIVTIEDTAELKVHKPNLVGLEAAKRQMQQKEVVNMALLLKNSLRMRPERLLLGEVRDAEAAGALLQAINTGHAGILSTLHANSATDALVRLDTLIAAGSVQIPFEAVRQQVRSNFDAIVHVARTPKHGRRVIEVGELQDGVMKILWRWNFSKGCHERVEKGVPRAVRYGAEHGLDIGSFARELAE